MILVLLSGSSFHTKDDEDPEEKNVTACTCESYIYAKNLERVEEIVLDSLKKIPNAKGSLDYVEFELEESNSDFTLIRLTAHSQSFTEIREENRGDTVYLLDMKEFKFYFPEKKDVQEINPTRITCTVLDKNVKIGGNPRFYVREGIFRKKSVVAYWRIKLNESHLAEIQEYQWILQ